MRLRVGKWSEEFEVICMLRKGQFDFWISYVGGGTEASFINQMFGVYMATAA